MKKRIYIDEWLEFKPYQKQSPTDNYYLKICNDVRRILTTDKQSFVLQMFLDKQNIDYLACFLTSYFEDLISETNIWNSFVNAHKRLYKKPLPFYNTEEYYEKEINSQDISFLIWYFLNTFQNEKFVSPYNDFIVNVAEKVMEVFDDAWEYAPENIILKSAYQIDANEEDFYVARILIDKILFKTYLFYPDTILKLRALELEIIEDVKDGKNLMSILSENRDNLLLKTHTRLLSFKGKEWASEISGGNNMVSKNFLAMSQRISGRFLYKGQDDLYLFIEHIASGKKFNITKKSFSHSAALKEMDTILFMGIAQWSDEWWFSGVFFQQPFNADIILDEKNSLKSRMTVNFLDHQQRETNELIDSQLKAFKDFNNGFQIAFISSDKIEGFVKSYTEFFNHSLNLSDIEKEAAIQRASADGFFGTERASKDYSEISETGLVFFNPKSGVEIALGVNCAFPLINNPFFDVKQSTDDIMALLGSEEMSTELALFCIDNCKNDLPFLHEGLGKKYLEDIDFLLRFWKKDNYQAKPSVTFT